MRPSRPTLIHKLLVLLALIAGIGCSRDPSIDDIRALHEARRYNESIAPLEQLLEKRPDDPELQYLYGVANLQTGNFSLALFPLRKARENGEWAARAGEALAQATLAAGDYQSAIEAATRVLEAQPENIGLLKLRAEAHLRENHYKDALPDVERIEALDPDDPDAPVMRLQCLIALDRLDEAESLFADLETRAGDQELPAVADERYCAARATFAKERDDLELAEKRFEECLERFPTSPVVVQSAVAFFDERKRSDRSNEILRTVLAKDPSDAQSREALAVRLRTAGQVKEAETLLLAGTKLDPPVAFEAWGGLASHYFQLGDYAASVSAWEQVLELTPQPTPDNLFGYAEALLRAGRYDQTLEVAKKLPEANAEIMRGMVFLEQKQPAKALQHFEAGLRLWPNHSVTRYYAAIAAERAGDIDRAISEYRQSVRSGAADTDAGLRLAEYHEAEGAYEPAFQAISLHLEAHPDDAEGNAAALRIVTQRSRTGRVRIGEVELAEASSRAAFSAKAAEFIARQDDPGVAIEYLEKASEVDFTAPEAADALRVLVTQLLAVGRVPDARARAEKALAAHPDVASFHAIRALALEGGGAPAEARAAYTRAVELDANCALALAGLARLELQSGNAESARSFYGRAAAADPKDVDSRRRAADLAITAGDLDDAQRRLEALVEDRPYDAGLVMALAKLLVQRGSDLERVRSLARQAVRFGGGPEAYALLVQTHLDAKEAERAAGVLAAAAEYRPDDASLHYQLGRALAATGKSDAARDAFEKALAGGEFPERNDAATALAALPAKADG